MNVTITPIPQDLSFQLAKLRQAFHDGEISVEEYNKRFQELQAEVEMMKMKEKGG